MYLCKFIAKHHAVRTLRSNGIMRLSAWLHMNGIRYHCLLEQSINLSTKLNLNLVLIKTYIFKLFFGGAC